MPSHITTLYLATSTRFGRIRLLSGFRHNIYGKIKCYTHIFNTYFKFVSSHKFAILIAYLLTPWCRLLLEKPTGLQLVKKFHVFHGTRRFIAALTSVRHLSLSWASPIQSIYPQSTSCRSILILSTSPY